MDGIERILRLLEDGKWHSIDDIATRVDWSIGKSEHVIEFLADHGLLQYRGSERMVKLDPRLLSLLKET